MYFGGAYGGATLENAKTAPIDLDEGAVSVGYELAFADIPEGEVTLSAPMPDDLTLAENERLYLDIGFSMQDETGEKVMVYDHIVASEQDGELTAKITPSGYGELSGNVYLKGKGFVSPTYSDKMRFDIQFKVKLVSASQSQRFNLIFDRSRFMATTVEPGDVEALLSRMEQVYAKYGEFGFDMSRRTEWPMDIHVTTLKSADAATPTYAQYVSSWWGIDSGHMNFSRLLFTNFNLDSVTSIFAHELMHFVQECYVTTQYKRLNWLDEATAVFLEKYFGGTGDHSARQYELYDGIYPASDSASAGYARGALVAYWASRDGWYDGADALSGNDKMSGLIDLYSTGGYLQVSKWQSWIDGCVGAPSEYAIDFFTKLLMGEESVWAEKLDKDAAVSISAKNGEELVLLKSLSKETTTQQGTTVSVPAFSNSLEKKYRYLVLVVNTTDRAKTMELVIAAEKEPEFDVKWFEGYWSTDPEYDSYPDVGIKILDGKNCAYFIGIMNRKMELDEEDYRTSSYIFDSAARTLIIENFYGRPGGIMLIARDKSEGDYGADYIKARKGEGYQYMAMEDIIRMK